MPGPEYDNVLYAPPMVSYEAQYSYAEKLTRDGHTVMLHAHGAKGIKCNDQCRDFTKPLAPPSVDV